MAKTLGVSVPTARAALNNLKGLNIVKEVSGSGKERLYIYSALIDILEQGAAPIA
jgi:ribosomal protein S25